jgi:predicted negative regulator of RcsB-dependent stress response
VNERLAYRQCLKLAIHAIHAIHVLQINQGQLKMAIAAMTGVLAHNNGSFGARLARGTALALSGDLQGAISDFDVAIESEPR